MINLGRVYETADCNDCGEKASMKRKGYRITTCNNHYDVYQCRKCKAIDIDTKHTESFKRSFANATDG